MPGGPVLVFLREMLISRKNSVNFFVTSYEISSSFLCYSSVDSGSSVPFILARCSCILAAEALRNMLREDFQQTVADAFPVNRAALRAARADVRKRIAARLVAMAAGPVEAEENLPK